MRTMASIMVRSWTIVAAILLAAGPALAGTLTGTAEVSDDARIAERADQIATAWIDERARD